MATVGDLFVQIRGRTDGLTKALKGARRRLRSFAASGTGMLAGIAAGFGAWKLGSVIMGQLLTESDEFRENWAKLQNTITNLLGELAAELGPILADAVSDMADWLANSEYVENAISGIGTALSEYVIPAIRTAIGWLETGSNYLAEWLEYFMGVEKQREALAQGVDMGEIEALVAERRARGARGSGPELAGAGAGGGGMSDQYLREIRDRIEVPR